MKLHRLILNGKSAGLPPIRTAVNQLREEGSPIEVRVTWEGGDAARYASDACKDGVGSIIAGGGDGSLNEVVNGMMNCGADSLPPLGILPLGTANDFATSCGIPIAPMEALSLAVKAEPVNVDVAKCNEFYFLNVASGGFGAEVTASTPTEMKKVLGGGAYSLVGIVTAMKMKPYQGRMIGPNGDQEAAVIVAAFGNGRQAGGGFEVTKRAYINDGLLDVMFVRDFPVKDLGIVLQELLDPKSSNQYVYYEQLPEFRIEADSAAPLNLDGEPFRLKDMKFETVTGRLV